MKKIKQPGDNFSLKTKKSEDPLVMQWINAQTNLMDSFRYLIEMEVSRNGVRNLQAIIPAERNVLGSSPIVTSAESQVAAAVENKAAATVKEEQSLEPEPAPSEDEFDDEDIESWI